MKKNVLRLLGIALVLSPAVAFTQSGGANKAATYITAEEIATVHKTPGVDRTVRVIDIGPENFSIGTIHRGKTGAPPAGGAPAAAAVPAAGGGAARGNAPPAEPCGARATTPPAAGAPTGL
jgi:hypothetical protein